jgi:enamine deaminase RidA (YjgF/YER057c/UK114 family)
MTVGPYSTEYDGPDARLVAMGIELPAPPLPAANYIPYRRADRLMFISGQVPFLDGELMLTGRLGAEVTLDDGKRAARVCTLNALAVARSDRATLSGWAVAQLMVFVASTSTFYQQHLVANGASDLLVEVFGEDGRHPRTAIAVPCLPLNAPVEVQLTLVEL